MVANTDNHAKTHDLSNPDQARNTGSMARLIEVEPRPKFRLKLKFSNGIKGEVDLSHLTGSGVFRAWNDESHFFAARITAYGAVAWGNEIEICPDALYLQLSATDRDRVSLRAIE